MNYTEWQVRYRYDGRKRTTTFGQQKDAEAERDKMLRSAESSRYTSVEVWRVRHENITK